jgi:energy-coupling factor transporter ATP-binding protein EcfA2
MSAGLLFNPPQASTEELESTFVGRHELLDRIENELLSNCREKSIHHWQIIGPRGSGKSHLTELLARRMRNRHGWRIARLPEENYHLTSLGELLEQIVVRSELSSVPSALNKIEDDLQLQQQALALLADIHKNTGRPLLVIVENLSAMLDRQLKSIADQSKLRNILKTAPPFVLIATSTSLSSALAKQSAPLYGFFETKILEDLTQLDITQLVRARADWEGNTSLLADFARVKNRIEAIYHLSGGNPRLALALYRVVQHGVTAELQQQIMKLLDEVTPYYQSRLNDISPQAARVLTEMAITDNVIPPAEIARRCRMPTNQVTAQIGKLLDERLVVHGGKPNGRSRLYEIKDRLLRIWIQMRESVGATKRLRFLAEFFEHWYADREDELEAFSKRTVSDFWSDLALGNDRRCVDRLKTLSYLAEVHPGFDDSVVLRAMSKQVDESSKSDIRSHVESLKKTFDKSDDLREREALAFLLSECFAALDAEGDANHFLKIVVDEGSQSETIATQYVSSLVASDSFREAWTFGNHWLRRYPNHFTLAPMLGLAACGLQDYANGFDLVKKGLGPKLCPHCTEKLLRRTLNVLRTTNADWDVEVEFWTRFIGAAARADASDEEIKAALKVLVTSKLSQIPETAFADAAAAWRPLSQAPLWLFSKSICGLAHRPSCEAQTLEFISALGERTSKVLSNFAVDHLIEILPGLRSRRDLNPKAAEDYLTAVLLVRQKTTAKSLGKAFRVSAPYIANRYKALASDLMELYREWLAEGLLSEPIAPYSDVLSVLSADDSELVLQTLHPENRDAVVLLLEAMGVKAGLAGTRGVARLSALHRPLVVTAN